MKLSFKLCLFIFFVTNFNALAAEDFQPSPPSEKIELSSENGKKILLDIENYLNSVTTIKADFIQSASNGSASEGSFYLKRPGKMRINYNPPMQVEIVADSRFLIYHDIPLEQVTYMNLSSSPAGILLNENISFSDPAMTVTNINKLANSFEISLVYKDNESSEVTLIFSEKPLALKQWRVLDAHRILTTVSLYNIENAINLDSSLFKFKDPKRPNPHADIR